MLNFFKRLFSKDLKGHLNKTKVVRINGVSFEIKKLNALNYIDGSKSLVNIYDVYKTKGQTQDIVNDKKIYEHFAHVICGGVSYPAISHRDDGSGIHIDLLFNDLELVVRLYSEIIEFTYGKKKLKLQN